MYIIIISKHFFLFFKMYVLYLKCILLYMRGDLLITCVCVCCPLSRDGIPCACKTCTVILRIGASYSSDISILAFLPAVLPNGDPGRRESTSDRSDLRSLVSNNVSWDSTTIH